MNAYDLVVIGGGPAGWGGANAAAAFGKRVALVEREATIGGAGLNTGTLPSKALRESALLLSGWRARKLLGIDVTLDRKATMSDLAYHAAQVREALVGVTQARMRSLGVAVVRGAGSFADAHTVRVVDAEGRSTTLRADIVLIATGSRPARPAGFPFDDPRVHESNQLLEIDTLPESLAVVGAGVIGAEYAGTFAALGVEVHLIDGRDTLLPFLDEDVSAAIAAGMQRNGVQVHWRERVSSCRADTTSGMRLTLASGREICVTDVLIAAGRVSNTDDLDLAAAGLTAHRRGLIEVNEVYQTAVPHIYAAGDVVGPPALAGTSMEQARIAVCHAFDLLKKELAPLLPIGIYTIPEASMVGDTETQVRKSGVPYVVGRASYAHNARGCLIGDDGGFLKLIFRREDLRLLGVHVVGEQATEAIHIGLMAMLAGAHADVFNRVCFNYPTLGDLYKHATYHALLKREGRILDETPKP
ncbi:MAG TPA: Si-specific NAD(P)(+) transhydrogenase [Burkholderiales bacterium]|nr:Si-specific NAD(P)(+) transhydrogenase [Burkholderiales bacterium]